MDANIKAVYMTPFTKRNLLISVSAFIFAGLLLGLSRFASALGSHVQHLEFIAISLMTMMSIAIMLFWSVLGVFGGLGSFLIALIFLYRPLTDLNPYYYGILIMAFFLGSFIGYNVSRRISLSRQKYTVTMEKIRENRNLIANHMKNRKAEVRAMGEKIVNLLKLKNIADRLSAALSSEEIVKIICDETAKVFRGDNRILLFMQDPETNEINLVNTMKGTMRKAFIMKNGGIFDRWAVKNAKSLIVKDVAKDFRFSLSGGETDDDATSLIIKPLMMESSVLGLLRIDSPRESAFSQHELRLLDIIGELASVALENARLYRQTEELAIRDSLTGIFVHRYFMERFEDEVKRALRSDSPFALIMLDLDNFKDFNDKHGHVAGDTVLKRIARILRENADAGDIVARYGGEEFALLSLDTGKKEAAKLAETIRKEIEDTRVTIRRQKYAVTVSVGVAVFPQDAKLREDLIWEADRRLYKAKSKGKNRVCSR